MTDDQILDLLATARFGKEYTEARPDSPRWRTMRENVEWAVPVVRRALEGRREPPAPPIGAFRCQHCGGTISTISTVHSVFFDDDGRHVQCVTLPRILRPFEEENR